MKTVQLKEFRLNRITKCVLKKKREIHSELISWLKKDVFFLCNLKEGAKKHIYSTVSNICRCFPTHHGRAHQKKTH